MKTHFLVLLDFYRNSNFRTHCDWKCIHLISPHNLINIFRILSNSDLSGDKALNKNKHQFESKLQCDKCRSEIVIFRVRRDTSLGIWPILNRLSASFNGRFVFFGLYHVILQPFNPILNLSDEKSDKPEILGLGRPFEQNRDALQLGWSEFRTENREKFNSSKVY